MDGNYPVESNRENLPFDLITLGRQNFASNLINDALAKLDRGSRGLEVSGMDNRISVDPQIVPQLRERHQIFQETGHCPRSHGIVSAQSREDANPDGRSPHLLSFKNIAGNLG